MAGGRKLSTLHHCPRQGKKGAGPCRKTTSANGDPYCSAHCAVCDDCATKIPFIKRDQECRICKKPHSEHNDYTNAMVTYRAEKVKREEQKKKNYEAKEKEAAKKKGKK